MTRDPDRLMRELMTRRTPLERLQMASRMFAAAKTLAAAGLGGQLSGNDLRKALFLRFYHADFRPDEREAIMARICQSVPRNPR